MTNRARKAAAPAAAHDDLHDVPYELLYLAGDIRPVSPRVSELLLLAASCLESELKGGIHETQDSLWSTAQELRSAERIH